MEQAILKLENITKSYDGKVILDDLNLEIGKNGYGHRPNAAKGETIEDYTYWYDKSGKQTYAQSRELWAEYFSYCMTGNEEALESLREHFPEASKVLDSIAEKIRSDIE